MKSIITNIYKSGRSRIMESRDRSHLVKWLPLSLLLIFMTGCIDDTFLPSEGGGDSNTVSFEATVMTAFDNGTTRSGDKPLYEPLVVTGDGVQPLYLHTYETDKIGYEPGEEGNVETRGNQITSAQNLIDFHKTFKVLARTYNGGDDFIPWTDAEVTSDKSIWRTLPTKYWPGSTKLAFYAVSPSAEFSRLQDFSLIHDNLSFNYTAISGNDDKDAEKQYDLMFASSACNKAGSVNGNAPLKFHHALSAVKFAIRDVMGGEIVNIKIHGVYSKGHCDAALYQAQSDAALNNRVEFTWTGQNTATTFSQNFNYKFADRIVDPNDETKDEVLNDKLPSMTFMMIPQMIPDDAEIEVTVKFDGLGTKVLRGKIKDNAVKQWKAGYEYVYTISTSNDNWVYQLRVGGNHDKGNLTKNEEQWGNQVYVYSPGERYVIDAGVGLFGYYHEKYGNEAYINVRSYRYRANNPSHVEPVKWEATNSDTEQYRVLNDNATLVPNHSLTAEEWITSRDALKGNGTAAANGEKKILEFTPHHQVSDWAGDLRMQDASPYKGNSESNPWDLATCGGNTAKNTANCYVVDREGWYSFPLVYGNGYKNGGVNANVLGKSGFQKHDSNLITNADITIDNTYTAEIIWDDISYPIDQVYVDHGNKTIVFHAVASNIQQGNVVIALKNGAGTIVWSWHIWFTEHWLDDDGIPEALGGNITFKKSASGWRDRGDLLIDNSHVGKSYGYYITPYNLGWCDPKNVDYLRRDGSLTVVQYKPDGTPSGLTAELPVLQEGSRVNFREGNNTYYQWGRKDPMIGFHNRTSTEKRNFANSKFNKVVKSVSPGETVSNPMNFYYNNDGWSDDGTNGYGNWTPSNYTTLWNLGADNKGTKTLYDPCPPGYMVPPKLMYHFIGTNANGSYEDNNSNQKDLSKFNGSYSKDNLYLYKACVVNKGNQTEENTVWLTATGERWDRADVKINDVTFFPGSNFNPQIVYLWSSTQALPSSGYSVALGYDNYDNGREDMGADHVEVDPAVAGDKYIISSGFIGRKTMSRPVRAIREF